MLWLFIGLANGKMIRGSAFCADSALWFCGVNLGDLEERLCLRTI